MTWLWTWGGTSFGYRQGGDLFTQRGVHVGRFYGDEVYGLNGRYLGEVKSGRLIRSKSKGAAIKSSLARLAGCAHVPHCNYVGYVMYVGFEDFPGPEKFS